MRKNNGMMLEKMINDSIKYMESEGIGVFHKKEVPVVFTSLSNMNNKKVINKGYLMGKSTTDYYGIYKGYFCAFEAKSTIEDTFVLSNVKKHQMEYLNTIEEHGGISFYIIYFISSNKVIFIQSSSFHEYLEFHKKKNLKLVEALEIGVEIEISYPGLLLFNEQLDLII